MPPSRMCSALAREAIQAQQPVAADRLSVQPDVVVEHDPVALADPPATQDGLGLLGVGTSHSRSASPVSGAVPAQGELLVQVAVCRARDVALVVDAPVGRDVDDAQVRVIEVRRQPLDADERARGASARVAFRLAASWRPFAAAIVRSTLRVRRRLDQQDPRRLDAEEQQDREDDPLDLERRQLEARAS